jgi:hypothetical protein
VPSIRIEMRLAKMAGRDFNVLAATALLTRHRGTAWRAGITCAESEYRRDVEGQRDRSRHPLDGSADDFAPCHEFGGSRGLYR